MIKKLSKKYSISCRFVCTRSGFKHVATVLKNGVVDFQTEVNYLNRTWESYEFETVLKRAIEKYFGDKEEKKFLNLV